MKTVLIYSEADQNSLPLAYADERYLIGGLSPAESYLNISKIIQAAVETGCDGIHPGYGFLSEDAALVKACEEAHLTFIGPSSKSLERLANKLIARTCMREAGVPIIPGSNDPLRDEDDTVTVADRTGYPVILKAVYGGGGRGMRMARNAQEVRRFFRVTKMEAASSFGRDEMYLEKRLVDPRHIEIQAIAEKRNKILILGERECSIQRRYQKLVEEAPSTAVSEDLKKRLSEATVNGLEAAGYTNAGTVEFLLEPTGQFYFLEVNKRLQVEHNVTELTTGIDIVEEQIKVAFESESNLSQNEIKINGWAINCRINAEDPRRNFTPSPGTIIHYHPPSGPGIRVDSALYSGHFVPEYYDSLILKLSTWGRHRRDAIERMKGALDELEIIGIPTTIPLHQTIMQDEQFISGQFNTTYLNTLTPKLNQRLEQLEKIAAAVAAANRTLKPPQDNQKGSRRSFWRGARRFHHVNS
jgi:acetyl-CoA carboxylase biotin carboxylase subunit